MDDTVYPTEARTLEMAHFASDEDARKFETEFRSYLVPGLLDGPELAPEVAKLEGLSGEWEEMDYRGIVDYMSGYRTVVRAESEWHLQVPNAEREGYVEVTGSSATPFAALTDFDSGEPPINAESARSGESDDWQFEPRPAMTSDGQPLGTVLYMTVYPADFRDSRNPAQVPPHQRSLGDEEQLVLREFDALDRADAPVPDDSRFHLRTLDVAHFEDPQQMDRFEADFRAALIPGLLDGPELAPDVAKLEGLLMLDLDTIGERDKGPLPVPVGVILDEFPTLGKLDSLVADVNLVRKHRISILIGAQTKGQFEMIYGREGTQALFTGLATQVIYGGCDADTAEFYSKASGTATTDANTDDPNSHLHQRPLLTVDEVITPQVGNCTIFARYVETGFATQAILNARLTRFYERADWKRRLAMAKGSESLLLERGIELDEVTEDTPAEPPTTEAIAGGASSIEIAARAKLEEIKEKTEKRTGGKVKMVTVEELRARRKQTKLELNP